MLSRCASASLQTRVTGGTTAFRMVSRNYLKTVGLQMTRGRDFDTSDRDGSQRVVIINEALAAKYFPNEDPIGKRVGFGGGPFWCEIVGIVGDVRHYKLAAEPQPEVYLTNFQDPWRYMTLVIRTTNNSNIIGSVREEILTIDRDQPVYNIRTMDEVLSDSVAQPRFNLWLLASFAGVALLLAVVGIYGVMSHYVTRRARDYGICIALGQTPSRVVTEVVRRGASLVVIGGGSVGLERAGIDLGERGKVVVDQFLQSSRDTIYAAGDVIGDPMFVYVAAYAGNVAAENALKPDASADVQEPPVSEAELTFPADTANARLITVDSPPPAAAPTSASLEDVVARTLPAVASIQAGSGRRANLFTGYTFAVWQGGELVPIAKAYSGLSDAEIEGLNYTSQSHIIGMGTESHRPVIRGAGNYQAYYINSLNFSADGTGWTNLTATLEQLAKLQPNFITFWQFQSWNLTYNVSVEFDDYHDRYYYVRRGIEFLRDGERYNVDHPRLLWDLGWFIGQKVGRADERVHHHGQYEQDQPHLEQGGEIEIGRGLGEFVGDRGRHGVAGLEQRQRDVVAVADDHGHRHRLAQGAAQSQHHRADYSGAPVGQHRGPDRLPARRAEAERRLALAAGDGEQHLARHRGDVRHDHDREDHTAREHRIAVEHALEKRRPAEHRLERRDGRGPQKRDEYEDPPQPVHDARNGGQELDPECHRLAHPSGRELGEEDRDPQGQGDRHQQREQR